jgi:hypothetical protein
MLESMTQLAEQAATNVSRRQFLGRFGQTAAGAAGVLAGLLLFPMDALARRDTGNPCAPFIKSKCHNGLVVCCPKGTKCSLCPDGFTFGCCR